MRPLTEVLVIACIAGATAFISYTILAGKHERRPVTPMNRPILIPAEAPFAPAFVVPCSRCPRKEWM